MSTSRVVALCGKGGVGKTAVAALLARALLEEGVAPLLLVDADPVGGLVWAVGARPSRTLAQVRAELVARARQGDETTRQSLATQLDYRLLEALCERGDHALVAMGRSLERGCFCPANALLREALDTLGAGFAAVLVDAEAGVEQIQREVTRRVCLTLVVLDGSSRSRETLVAIQELLGPGRLAVVMNRVRPGAERRILPGSEDQLVPLSQSSLPPDIPVLGAIPEDDSLRALDEEGRPLWDLPRESPAAQAAQGLAQALLAFLEAHP